VKFKIYTIIILPIVFMGVKLGLSLSYNEELHNLYPSPDIIMMMKSKRMSCKGHAARMGEKRNAYTFWPEHIKRQLGRHRCKWGTIFSWIFKKLNRRMWSDSSGSEQTNGGLM
jgi:hypothetical protein